MTLTLFVEILYVNLAIKIISLPNGVCNGSLFLSVQVVLYQLMYLFM
jgi:hypothetical protein